MEVLNLPTVVLSFLLVLLTSVATSAQNDFSRDSALAVLKALSVDIGPRPMGSPAEQRAMQFAIEKFHGFGCQQAYVMPMTVAEGVNTKSGVAVGMLKGKTDRIIIIGAHVDSSGPDVPGTNDDGSGVACVIELARVLSRQEHESTIMFCCWGGEEEGLRGSKYFVDHFDRLDSVVLMLQIDMADGASILNVDPDGSSANAPRWLTDAAFDIFYNDLSYSDLVYPVHGATFILALGTGAGSDHISFIDKGIPAIGFTSDVNYPIHTPQDSWENFTRSGLQRSGDLVLRLFERFDGGVPSRSTERYMLVRIGETPLMITYPGLWTFIALSFLVCVVAYVNSRKRRRIPETATRVHWSALKLFLFALIIQTFVWYSENLVGLIRDMRFPWVNNFRAFAILGTVSGLVGLWVVLQWARKIRLSHDHHVYARVAFGVLILECLLASFRSPEVAVYPASALFLFSIAMLLRSPLLKLLFVSLSPYMMFRLLFHESLGLIQRLLASNRIYGMVETFLYNTGFVLFFTFYFIGFVFAFAAVYRDSRMDLLWLKRFSSSRLVLAGTSLAALGMIVYLTFQPTYNTLWYNDVRVEQRFTLGADSSAIMLKGTEFLNGVMVNEAGTKTTLDERTNIHEFNPTMHSAVTWCSVHTTVHPSGEVHTADSVRTLSRQVTLRSELQPYHVGIIYRSSHPFDVQSPWAHGSDRRLGKEFPNVKTFSWYSFPDTNLIIPVTFTLKDSQEIIETIQVTYDTLEYPIAFNRALTNFAMRTVVTTKDTFGMHARGISVEKGAE